MSLTYQDCLQAVNVVIASGSVPTIVGEAGIGKSALVADLARQRDAKLFTTVVSLVEKGDLVIPVPPLTSDSFVQTADYGSLADVQFGYSHTLVAMIRYAQENPQREIIWFLDEFNRGTQAVQSELMNLVLQRQINTLKLPLQVHLVLAENPDATMAGFEQSHYGVTPGDAAIADRTTRLILTADSASWLDWATTEVAGRPRLTPLVTDYVAENPADLHLVASGTAMADEDLQPTPRAWERVSDALRELDRQHLMGQTAILTAILQGNLGTTVGTTFASYVQKRRPGLTVEEAYTIDDAPAIFAKLTPAQQQQILRQCLDALELWPLTKGANAHRFETLLDLCPADAQYAVARDMAGIDDLFESLADQTVAAPGVADLYQTLTTIGQRGSQIEV